MVAARLKRNFKLLRFLKKAKRKHRSSFLKTAPTDVILCLCDCAHNVLRGNIHLKKKDRDSLRRYKKALRQLTEKKSGVEKKRKFLIQKGGFLPYLLGPIISAAGGIIGNLIKRASD